MAKRPSPEELALWQAAMRDAKPLKRIRPAAKKAASEPPAAEPSPPTRAKPALPPPAPPLPAPKPPELAPGRFAGVDKRLAERLKRGQLAIEAMLDLHGLTQEEAHRQLDGFLALSARAGRRCVLVITGKGAWRPESGILREMVPRWLNEAPNRARVLAIAHAQPRHGGTGALYVLLKRRREE
ncbi:MAG: Smr/MutS family protein [Dongiaceae bacterium]